MSKFSIGDRVYFDGNDRAVFHESGYGTVVDRQTAMGGLFAEPEPDCTVVEFDESGHVQEILDRCLSVPQ